MQFSLITKYNIYSGYIFCKTAENLNFRCFFDTESKANMKKMRKRINIIHFIHQNCKMWVVTENLQLYNRYRRCEVCAEKLCTFVAGSMIWTKICKKAFLRRNADDVRCTINLLIAEQNLVRNRQFLD